MVKKYGLFGTILSISILITMMILGPTAAAATPVDEGDLLSQVQAPLCTLNPVATGVADHDVTFISNPVVVTVDWTIDNQCIGEATHGFFLRITNIGLPPTIDEDEYHSGVHAGPYYDTGTLTAQVDGSVDDEIEIYIYVNVTYGVNFDEDDATWIITLVPP
jgi:hypothetical protein